VVPDASSALWEHGEAWFTWRWNSLLLKRHVCIFSGDGKSSNTHQWWWSILK
jgi:hypothetical protein